MSDFLWLLAIYLAPSTLFALWLAADTFLAVDPAEPAPDVTPDYDAGIAAFNALGRSANR